MNTYGIYVLVDEQNRIIAINSEGILSDTTGWTRIDEYESDVPYAQGNYFSDFILDVRGAYRYKLVDGEVIERTPEEMEADVVQDENSETSVSDTDIALTELAALLAENCKRLDEQDAALVELASLIVGGEK